MSPLLTLILGLLAGIGAGYVLFQTLERRKTGGKTAAELKQEHEAYREQVQQHFGKTSDLFQSMTMQYRELYDHLAEGAQSLCESTPTTPALDLSNKALLPDAGSRKATETESGKTESREATSKSSDDDDVPVARADSDDEEIEMGADAGIAPQQIDDEKTTNEPTAQTVTPPSDTVTQDAATKKEQKHG